MALPRSAGLGFKAQHFPAIRETKPQLGFFEIHAENYLGEGGAPHAMLTALRQDYALSIHGVGLSIGGPSLDETHLARVKALCDRYEPDSFSEHLAWSSHGAEYLNDLLPLPYTAQTLQQICDHVDHVQEVMGRRLLLENPSTYVIFAQSEIPETEFMNQIAQRTGCGLLLDVNNVFVSCVNHRMDPLAYLNAFPLHRVGEIHLGGHDEEELPSGPLLIDSHGSEVAEPVWALYGEVLSRTGAMPSLVEWDNDLPDWQVLLAEAQRAETMIRDQSRHAAAQ
ncbi:MNIO family bufferin maturase [Paracoccus seriniphilus]|uniref:MNIO family bufferin maturase n=1 Tax=Paracoccus seriniphilus TaxID=184748 RepID=UPI003561414E